ncbi:MAG: hypothetical protein LBS19_09700 [Clostridiales bacterium]|jgi:flagellar hook assembly protein FlgD|nr:hypothetical protein [Clostridiales bacterium]
MANEYVDGVLQSDYKYGVATSPLAKDIPKKFGELDKDAFIKLLIAQLQYQDPLEPMDDKAFIAQMAQFSALEQMQNMNTSYAKSQAYSMIGRTVQGTSYIQATNSYEAVEGVVTSVKFVSGQPVLVVDTGGVSDEGNPIIKDLELTGVENVYDDYSRLSLLQNMNNNVANQQSLTLVGQWVQAITVDENGKPNGYMEGIVDSVMFGAKGTRLLVNGYELDPGAVISVGEKSNLLNGTKELNIYVDGGWHKGVIAGIDIQGDNILVGVNNGTETKYVPIKELEGLVTALNMLGKRITSYGREGTVSEIRIEESEAYVVVQDDEGTERYLLASEVKVISQGQGNGANESA